MYKYLIDTHILIWWLEDNKKLSVSHKKLISDANNIIFFSVASIWEAYIKKSIGRLILPNNFLEAVIESGFVKLDISLLHAKKVSKLNFTHKDPFDRMLIAQSIVEDLTVITVDKNFKKYKKVKLI